MGYKNYTAGGLVAAVLLTISVLMPTAVSDNRAHASPAIPAMLLQTLDEAENQCRITQESCMINSDRCKANYDNAVRQQNQCKAQQDKQYRACYDRVYQTVRPGISTNRQRVVEWKNHQAKRQCQYLKDTNRSCPRPKDGCYSRGYCIQQYQRCSSNAFLQDQSNNPPSARPRNERQPERSVRQAPPPRSEPKRRAHSSTVLKRAKQRASPAFFEVRLINPCTHPVRAAYAYNWGPKNRDYVLWGWETIPARGDTIVKLPKKMHNFYAYFDQAKLDRRQQTKKLLYINHDSDFRAGLNLDNRPAKPNVPEAQYTYITGSGWLLRQNYKKYNSASITGCGN